MNTDTDQVILVNEQGQPIGVQDKLLAHQLGNRHLAFSIFIFYKHHNETQLLLQKRHPSKYHSGGLWSNTCCSHPRPTENIVQAAHRRLKEEVGISTTLKEVGAFIYQTKVNNQLIEHEFDTLYVGILKQRTIHWDVSEIEDTQWVSLPELNQMLQSPQQFTPWFLPAWEIVKKHII